MITTPETTQRLRVPDASNIAEVCAAVVFAGETSLASALVNGDWVTAHEWMGRNRPTPEAEDRHDQRP